MNVTDGSARSSRPTTTQVSKPTQQAPKQNQPTQQAPKKDTVSISEEAKIKAAAIKNRQEAESIAKEKAQAEARAKAEAQAKAEAAAAQRAKEKAAALKNKQEAEAEAKAKAEAKARAEAQAQAKAQAAAAQRDKEKAAAIKNKQEAAVETKAKTQTHTITKTDNSKADGKLKLPGCEADNVTEIKEGKLQAGGKASCTGPSAGFIVNEKGNISGGGKITIGEVEIHAKGAVDGKYSPSISLGAEATLHKYEANVDVKIPFTNKSISLNGSLGVGSIGAHYEAGVKKYQSYIALGVGLGAGIELKDSK